MKNKKWSFSTVEGLLKFIKELEENPGEILNVDYFRLTAVLGNKQNRKLENESDKYIDREIAGQDSLTAMRIAEKKQHPSSTLWMLKIPTITVINKKGEQDGTV